jgi:hypothetical protein
VLFALGNTARALGQPLLAQDFYSKVLALEPGRLEAVVNLANLLRGEGQFEAARALLAPALARNPESPELHLTMGSAFAENGDNAQAIPHYRATLDLNPNYAPALANLADLLADDGDRPGALELYGRALKSDPANAQARMNRAVLHLLAGHLKDGWRDYAARCEIPGKVPAAAPGPAAWTGGSLKKTRLLVRTEQGVGDAVMFASLFSELIAQAQSEGGSVILECDKRLVPLLARSFPAATVCPADLKTISGQIIADYGWLKSAGGANQAVLMGSLPRYLRKSQDSFPAEHVYLKSDLGEQIRWHGVFAGLGPAPVIGICWRSGKTGGHRGLQYAPLAAWAEFLKTLPGTLVSAQYDAGPEEIAELEILSDRRIFVPPALDQKNELDRVTAMLSALDVVVSAPTAVSWLAAGVGVKTLKILYYNTWTSLGLGHEPFAPACLCVTPKIRGDWAEVFSQAEAIIARL